MSYFKKFTDFCAGIAAFVASLFLLRKYMAFSPVTNEEVTDSKLTQFFKANADYDMLVSLVILLALSVAVGIVFRRLPYLCFAFSLLPVIMIAYMFENNCLFEQPALYAVCAALHFTGNLVDCAMRDRDDGRHRLWIATKLSALCASSFCLFVTKYADKVPADSSEEIPLWKRDIFFNMTPADMQIITKLGWMLLALFIIGLLLYNVYFIDAILSLVPLIYSVHALYSGSLTLAPKTFTVLCAICFIAHVMTMVLENNLSYREQNRLRQVNTPE